MAIRRRSKVLQRADKRSLVRTLSFAGMVGGVGAINWGSNRTCQRRASFLATNYRLERKRRQGSSGMAVAVLALPETTTADGGKSLPVP